MHEMPESKYPNVYTLCPVFTTSKAQPIGHLGNLNSNFNSSTKHETIWCSHHNRSTVLHHHPHHPSSGQFLGDLSVHTEGIIVDVPELPHRGNSAKMTQNTCHLIGFISRNHRQDGEEWSTGTERLRNN